MGMKDFLTSIDPGDVAFVYYAGYAAAAGGESYLLPTDSPVAPEPVAEKAMQLRWLLESLAQRGVAAGIVAVDACILSDGVATEDASEGGAGVLAPVTVPSDMLVAFSSAPCAAQCPQATTGVSAAVGQGAGPEVELDEGQLGADNAELSPYARHLLTQLGDPELLVEQVFKRTRRGVAVETGGAQVPWEASSLLTDLVLNSAADSARDEL